MNEQIKLQGKIKELSKQAGFTGKFDFPYGANLEPTVQRFAELIVRECAETIKNDMELAHIQLVPIDFKMYANGRLQRTIKEHFGVE